MSIIWVFGVMALAVVLSFILTLLLGFEDVPIVDNQSKKSQPAPAVLAQKMKTE